MIGSYSPQKKTEVYLIWHRSFCCVIVFGQLNYTTGKRFVPFLWAKVLTFQGSTHHAVWEVFISYKIKKTGAKSIMAKVSIIIPVYNVEQYLKECLDSIQNQTLKDIEIICIDDGSTDLSAQILDEYAKNDQRFRVVHKANEGYGKAMNIGIRMTTAPYVGIVESDDKIEHDMYETLYLLMEETQVDVMKADYYEFYQGGDGEIIKQYVSSIDEGRIRYYIQANTELVTELLGLYDVPFHITEHEEALLFEKYTWSGLYSRRFLVENHILHNETPGASYQDNGFWFQTMVKAERIYFVKQAFYHYRIDNLNSSIHSRAKVFAVCDEFDFIRSALEEMGEEGKRFYKWISYFKVVDCIANMTRVGDEHREPLAKRIKEEFLEAIDKDGMYADMYASHWRSDLFEILMDYKNYAEKEKKRANRIDHVLVNYHEVIIYGAGVVGQRAYSMLKEGRRNIKVKYFAVTEQESNPVKLFHVPVKTIRELQKYKETALIIVAVGKKYIQEVEELLKAQGFSHYVLLDDLVVN